MNVEAWIPAGIAALAGAVQLGIFVGSQKTHKDTQARAEKAIDDRFDQVDRRFVEAEKELHEKFEQVDRRFAAAEKELHHVSTLVTAMAAQDPAVIQRLTAAEAELVRLRDRQHASDTQVTILHAKTDINARDVAEVRGALFGTQPKPSAGAGGQP